MRILPVVKTPILRKNISFGVNPSKVAQKGKRVIEDKFIVNAFSSDTNVFYRAQLAVHSYLINVDPSLKNKLDGYTQRLRKIEEKLNKIEKQILEGYKLKIYELDDPHFKHYGIIIDSDINLLKKLTPADDILIEKSPRYIDNKKVIKSIFNSMFVQKKFRENDDIVNKLTDENGNIDFRLLGVVGIEEFCIDIDGKHAIRISPSFSENEFSIMIHPCKIKKTDNMLVSSLMSLLCFKDGQIRRLHFSDVFKCNFMSFKFLSGDLNLLNFEELLNYTRGNTSVKTFQEQVKGRNELFSYLLEMNDSTFDSSAKKLVYEPKYEYDLVENKINKIIYDFDDGKRLEFSKEGNVNTVEQYDENGYLFQKLIYNEHNGDETFIKYHETEPDKIYTKLNITNNLLSSRNFDKNGNTIFEFGEFNYRDISSTMYALDKLYL